MEIGIEKVVKEIGDVQIQIAVTQILPGETNATGVVKQNQKALAAVVEVKTDVEVEEEEVVAVEEIAEEAAVVVSVEAIETPVVAEVDLVVAVAVEEVSAAEVVEAASIGN